jgi:uncharacterized membrane protein
MMRARISRNSRLSLPRDDEGSILPLAVFYGVLSLVLILVVIAATSLYLERKRLFTLADGAAIVGAEAFDLQDVTVTPDGPRIVLRSADVSAAVEEYIAGNPSRTLEGVRVESATTVDGSSATVELSAYWRPPVVVLFVPDGIRLEASVVARSVVF